MRVPLVYPGVVGFLLVAPIALAAQQQQRSSLYYSGSSFIASGQIVQIDIFVNPVRPDLLEVRGSVAFRNESASGYCAQVLAALVWRQDSIVALGRPASACVNGSMGTDIVRPIRIEGQLQPLDRRGIPNPYDVRLVARAISDTTIQLTPANVKEFLLRGKS